MSKLYNTSAYNRSPADFYSTPPDLTAALPDGLSMVGLQLEGPILEPCCGEGALANALVRETNLSVLGTDLYPERYPIGHRFYVSLDPVDARDITALKKIVIKAGVKTAITNPPYGRDHYQIANSLLGLVHDGIISLAALLVPHQFDAASSRIHLFTDKHCRLRIVMPWRPAWIQGTPGGGTISSVWWIWTACPRPTETASTVYVKRRMSYI